ncbi:serine/threonine-protein kinase EDR1-like isoform X1 [Zingiber officinale]|uniref:serine/threonine-protein kinase EDR1-like isoform X1 n=1 Tax=Zingiber officinale TaxID=94328 RepID=UPI001C4BFB0A|nr:serine/threonine-protein kinase EDR1-like isoform X1 [Zingiber officinale]
MKNIFKIKRHPHRSNEIPSPSSVAQSPAPSPTAAASPSCAADHRAASSGSSPTTPSPVEPPRATAPPGEDRQDYFSSEEEFQVQLALAISASNSEFGGDLDGDQIRAAKLLSLGRDRINQDREEGTSESLSRSYWDYNVLDYDDKVVDGFYDIYGLSGNSASQRRMPSLTELQTRIGDLGFEVIVVNRAIDPALVELEQVAQCILLGCPTTETGVLVQRVSELVMDHMGGPVRDANDTLTKWMEKSTELRTTLQTSLLPIGCIRVGLSRHRALLFKVLADNIGIPCKLVKGSHYTGMDDDAINIIKLDEREFLVDLMAAPGTLIPADVLSLKETSSKPIISKRMSSWASRPEDDFFNNERLHLDGKTGNPVSSLDHNQTVDKRTIYESPIAISSVLSDRNGESSTSSGRNSRGNMTLSIQNGSDQSTSTSVTTSKQKGIVVAVSVDGNNLGKGKLNSNFTPQDAADVTNLFADLNPFRETVAAKAAPLPKVSDGANMGYQRHRENIAIGPGRSQVPLVWKGRSACNEIPNTKQNNLVESNPQRNFTPNASSSKMPSSAAKAFSGVSTNVAGSSAISNSVAISENQTRRPAMNMGYHSSEYGQTNNVSENNMHHKLDRSRDVQADKAHISISSSEAKYVFNDHGGKMVLDSSQLKVLQKQGENADIKHDKQNHDRLTEISVNTVHQESSSSFQVTPSIYEESSSCSQVRPSKVDPVLDDVANWEIRWEELIIGERIGLGSYGEVYRADWNGEEVAVKKFLDQDFYGDALDEFRSEVRIMRRLRHPNVVLFMGAVTRPPNLSIVSEFLPRGSLYRILHRPNCQIDENLRIKMALDVAKGMNCLHTSIPTIVHRDLKSPNLLVDKNWTVKVCDFGLSRLKHSTFLSSKSTAGTPEWMAPEVLRNEKSNEKCDVYSFGVILWELATLRMPWSGMNPMQVVGAVGFQNRRLDIPKEVDPLVARIIWECWQTDPSLRPSFAQLTTALNSLQRLVIPSQQEPETPLVPQEISVKSTP